MATPKTIAEWMLEELKRETILCQEVVAHEISMLFGDEFTYTNENGELALDERVLREFRKLTENMVLSIGGERVWRLKR
jgi:hypothetical protein